MSDHPTGNSPESAPRKDKKPERALGGRRPVVFLDRDGTLNEELGYIFNVDDLALLPDALKSVVDLNHAGVACIVVTNQSGPARGFYSEEHVRKLNDRLVRLLAEGGAHVDAVYYCPHHAEGVVAEYAIACECRKPKPGMILETATELGINLTKSFMVGDRKSDIKAGRVLTAQEGP